ncbi:MAG: hypothetical protein RLO51_26265 [Thalassobaculum sp.]|uniref:hypothetical protein n=1 Tax=Thalassobaculum sp. TaxID=2022740 RepID=UPI0032EC8063
MKDFAVPAGVARPAAADARSLVNHRLAELERRVGRVEAFILGVLCAIALSVLGGLVALLNLPRP